MLRLNHLVIFSVSLFCVLGSIKTLYANIQIANAYVVGARLGSSTDPCAGLAIGAAAPGGAICAGSGYSTSGLSPILRYMVTPGGCSSETCASAGGTDSVFQEWANNSGTTADVTTGITDPNNGKRNTAMLSPYYTDTDAAHWCTQMNYGGYSDWYLPSLNELNYVLYNNKAALAGFQSFFYWSSTEAAADGAWSQTFTNGSQSNNGKTNTNYVRCVRSY
jgi:hypothetical protein